MTGRLSSTLGVGLIAATLGVACNALDEKPPESGTRTVVPTDTRASIQALTNPPPITGGTLAVSPDGLFAVAADPARDRISVLNLTDGVVHHLALEPGDEPGRVAVDGDGRAHVALRRAGDVVSLELSTGEQLARRAACAAPRGITLEPATGMLHVACAEGKLVSLPADGGPVSHTLQLDDDLRDVILRDGQLVVSRFKSAELLVLDPATGETTARTAAPPARHVKTRIDPDGLATPELRTLSASVAWRSVATSEGVLMLHQHASNEEIALEPEADSEAQAGQGHSSPYGGSSGGFEPTCDGIVQTTITHVSDSRYGSFTVPGAVHVVDLALGSRGQVALAQAGVADPEAPRPFEVSEGGSVAPTAPLGFGNSQSTVMIAPVPSPHSQDAMPFLECVPAQPVSVDGQATAVAFTSRDQLVVQTREPARLVVIDSGGFGGQQSFDLDGESLADTGHDLFSRDAGAGIACASCHAEGGEDGHVWNFSTLGARRTQAVHVGLEGTAPFHWDGDMHDLGELMTEVFVGRMGGVPQSGERKDVLASWLFALRPPPAMRDHGDPAAERGKVLFESAEVGCTSCHSGESLTNSESFDVGTTLDGHPLQVPSLRGIAYRAPFLHTGCAPTLRDRFEDGDCGGGDLHGRTSQLSDAEIDDLVAYLQTL